MKALVITFFYTCLFIAIVLAFIVLWVYCPENFAGGVTIFLLVWVMFYASYISEN